MTGAVSLATTREPSYFAGEGLAGGVDRTFVHRSDGKLDGAGRMSTLVLHRDGAPRRIAYLGELRVDEDARGGSRMLRDGYRLLRRCVEEDGAELCFTSVATDNARARRVLERGRALGLPEYVPLADLVTLAIPVGSPPPARRDEPASDGELTDFLRAHARQAQLAPTWDEARWTALATHGVTPADFRVVREGGRIVAAGAVWDQRAFRQIVACAYAGALRVARPFVNVLNGVGLAPPLPAPGSVVPQAAILGASVEDDSTWPALVTSLRRSAAARGLDWLTIARETRDPQLSALRRLFAAREYRTRLYEVRWPDEPAREPWGALPFRPEVGLL